MTADPFKMKKFNDDMSSLNDSYHQGYSSLPVSFISQSAQNSNLNINNYSSSTQANIRFTSTNNQSIPELNQDSSNLNNNQAFIQAHYDANKELIAQLKANIDLLFKGAKLFGQFTLYPLKAIRWQCQVRLH